MPGVLAPVFPAGAGMNRPSSIASAGAACAVFPAGAGMNRRRSRANVIHLGHVFPAGAGMNRRPKHDADQLVSDACSPQARG